jgi:hypothetical protein
MAHVAVYVTGHGFGHATRMAAIVGALAERVSDLGHPYLHRPNGFG